MTSRSLFAEGKGANGLLRFGLPNTVPLGAELDAELDAALDTVALGIENGAEGSESSSRRWCKVTKGEMPTGRQFLPIRVVETSQV